MKRNLMAALAAAGLVLRAGPAGAVDPNNTPSDNISDLVTCQTAAADYVEVG
jgi:hypothetical protein